VKFKIFNRADDAVKFAKELDSQGNVAMAFQRADGTAIVKWVVPSTYIAQDGKEYPDEVWVMRNGDLKNISELSEEHAKNILRMFLRQDREDREAYAALADTFVNALGGVLPEDEEEEFSEANNDPNRVTLKSLLDDTPPPSGTLLN
jgi:hypothetical protein